MLKEKGNFQRQSLTRPFPGQSLSEYSIFLAIVLIALVAMNVYVKRGLQGRYKDVTDSTITAIKASGAGEAKAQYEPYYVDSRSEVNAPRDITENIESKIKITKALLPTSTIVKGLSTDAGSPD